MLVSQTKTNAGVRCRFRRTDLRDFLDDIAQGHLTLLKVEDKHLETAANLISILPNHALRTLDALHLAIAQHHGLQLIATIHNEEIPIVLID